MKPGIKPVYRGVVTVSLFLLLLAMPASALTGYYESFNDSNDSGSNTVAEPVAWYTVGSSPTTLGQTGIGYGTLCGNYGGTACGSSQSQTFAIGALYQPGAGVNWDMSYSYSLLRKCGANGNPANIGCTAATTSAIASAVITGGLHSIVGNYIGSPTSTQQQDQTGCASPNDSVVSTVGTGLARSGAVSAHYEASTTTLSIVSSGGVSCSIVNSLYENPTGFAFTFYTNVADTTNDGATQKDLASIGGFTYTYTGATGTYTIPVTPVAPAGLTAKTIIACTASGSMYTSTIELKWPLSISDPDQTVGSLTYYIYFNGINYGADTTTGQDGSGHRYATFTSSGNGATCNGLSVFWIVASDRGLNSNPSCSVQINDNTQNQAVTCGANSGGISTNPAASTGNPLGQMVQTMNAAWGFDWSWIIGAIIMAICIAAVWMMGDFVVAVVILLVAVANARLGLWPEWSIFAIVFVSIAMAGNRLFGKKGEAEGDSA